MKTVLTDHGKILHWAGAHQLFPVVGPQGPEDVSFASPGALEGRQPIGWNLFFPALARSGKVVVADAEEGTLTVVLRGQAQATTDSAGSLERPPG